jgi:hypothetical protein
MNITPLLTEQERSNPITIKIIDEMQLRIDRYRKMNDYPDCDPLIRGRIQELTLLQAKINSKPKGK